MALKVRLHWFENQVSKAEAEQMRTLCSNGVIAAVNENDLRAFFIYSLKEYAYEQVLYHKEYSYSSGNDWVHYPEDTDDSMALTWAYQHIIPGMPVASC